MGQVTNVKLSLEFDSGHAAMVDDPHAEVCRILDTVKAKIMSGYVEGAIYELNGNKVGAWHFGIERDDSDDAEGEEE